MAAGALGRALRSRLFGSGNLSALPLQRAVEAPPAPDGHWLGEPRLYAYSLIALAIVAATYAVWIWLSLPGLIDPRGKPVGYDFIAFWSAARLALDGHPEAVFDWDTIAAMHKVAVPGLSGMLFPWHYPPTSLLAVLPLGLLPYPAALAGFLAATAGLWFVLVRRLDPDPRVWLVVLAMPAGLFNLLDGQNAFLTAALAGFALLLLDRRPWLAGLLIGLLAIKPHLALLFPVALVAAGRWRTIAAAALTVAVLTAASLAAFGWDTWAAFLHYLPTMRSIADNGWVPWGLIPSPYIFALSLGLPAAIASALQAAALFGAAAAVWRVWRMPAAPFEAKAAVLLAGSMLVSPYFFSYDLMWAGFAAAWLYLLGRRRGFRRGEREVLLAAWLAPVLMAPLYAATHVQIGFPITVALLAIALRRARIGAAVAGNTAAALPAA